MEKVKLSEMIIYYEAKKGNKDNLFGDYFEEKDIDQKLSRLKLMYETLGDIELPLNHIRAFLYVGMKNQNKNEFEFSKPMIKDVTEIITTEVKISSEFLLTILQTYDEECYKEYDIKGFVQNLLKEENQSDIEKKYYDFLRGKKEELIIFYKKEAEKIENLKEEYRPEFISDLQKIIIEKHVKAEEVIQLIPSTEFIKKATSDAPAMYNVIAGEEIVTRTLRGYIDLDKIEDEEKIILGYTQYDTKITASFTKKEYLEEIQDKKQIKR